MRGVIQLTEELISKARPERVQSSSYHQPPPQGQHDVACTSRSRSHGRSGGTAPGGVVVPHGGKAALMGVTASRYVDLPVQYSCSVAVEGCVQRVTLPAGGEDQRLPADRGYLPY